MSDYVTREAEKCSGKVGRMAMVYSEASVCV
jgi:hypothetical protein